MIILHSHGVGRGVQAQSNTAADNNTKAMERLSTGSRINHAQEDASFPPPPEYESGDSRKEQPT